MKLTTTPEWWELELQASFGSGALPWPRRTEEISKPHNSAPIHHVRENRARDHDVQLRNLKKEGLLVINPSNGDGWDPETGKRWWWCTEENLDFQSRIFSWRMLSISIFGNPIQQEMRGLVRVKFSHWEDCCGWVLYFTSHSWGTACMSGRNLAGDSPTSCRKWISRICAMICAKWSCQQVHQEHWVAWRW